MGAYLSTPNTEKYSSDHINEILAVGASSMQGWRNSQEDAHNSILDFDKDTALFAVYDGHGGAEVAAYCAEKLPEFLKKLETYQKGNLEQALKDAFLGFDQTLLEPHVVDLLKILAGEKNGEAEEDDMEEDDEDLAELHEESNLPLNEVIGKNYKGHPSMPALNRLQDLIGASSVNQKPQSPYLRGRRAAAVAADNANRAVLDPDSKPAGSSTSAAAAAAVASAISASDVDGPGPSSSSTKIVKSDPEDESAVSSSSNLSKKDSGISSMKNADKVECEATAVASTNGSTANAAAIKVASPRIKESEQNGNVTSSEAKAINASVATSSSNKLIKEDEDAVSGSSDKSVENLQNGNASSSDISSSTNKGKKFSNFEDDSTDDENDFQVEDSILVGTRRAILECGSDDDDDDEDADIAGEMMDDEDDEDEDDDEDADDEDDEMEDGFYTDFYTNMIEEPGKDSGCTAVVGLLHGRDLYVANAGDSRCVVSRNGKAIEMSLDHKPEDDEEASRIINAGGKVTLDGRVNGGLNLSRAIGDHAYKMNLGLPPDQQMISALPDIRKLIISPEDEFMVLACDGIWNFMTSEEVVTFVGKRIKDDSKKLSEVCEELFDNCLAPNTIGDGTGCDNMTAVIVKFKPKILEMSTKLDPNEAEDILAQKRAVEAAATKSATKLVEKESPIVEDQVGNLISMKRCASPTFCETDENADSNEAAEVNKTKRLKTDEKEVEVEVSSTPAATSASDEIVSSETSSGLNSKNEANEAQEEHQNECTSTSSTTSNEDPTTVHSGVSEVSST